MGSNDPMPLQQPLPGPIIYCCFHRRFGHCRFGDRCRYQHAPDDLELYRILHIFGTYGLCERQVAGHRGYPCRHHGRHPM